MRRASATFRVLTSLILLASSAGAGWASTCTRRDSVAAGHGGHGMMHGAMHHHRPAPAPDAPRQRHGDDGCPPMAMNGGTCLGAAQAARPALAHASRLAADAAYPPAAGVHDRLPSDGPFHPPRG